MVTKSSGSALLDRSACRGILRYSRFHPALDENGDPKDGSFRTTINYQLSDLANEPIVAPDPSPSPPVSPAPAKPRINPLPLDLSRGASARNQRRWGRKILEDYPAEARQAGIYGTVGVKVIVTPEGRATDCKITSSSGKYILDAAACKGMEEHARFNPALDQVGELASGRYFTRITYHAQE